MPVPDMPVPKSEFIWFDGDFVRWDEARVHVLSHVLHYGSSVFEGIRCYDTPAGPGVFRLREHLERLRFSARIIRIEIPYSDDELESVCVESIRKNGFTSCYLRPLVFRGAGSMGLLPANNPIHTMIATWEWGAYLGKEGIEQGIDVMVSTWRKPPPSTMPALAKIGGAYALATIAKMEAVRLGFAESLLLDVHGRVAEGSGENLFVVVDGRILTPPLSHSVLGGLTRKSVMQLAADRGMQVVEQSLDRAALYMASEAFLTGTAAEVTPIRSVDGIPVGEGKPGPVTRRLQQDFFDVVNGRTPDRHGWLTVLQPSGTRV